MVGLHGAIKLPSTKRWQMKTKQWKALLTKAHRMSQDEQNWTGQVVVQGKVNCVGFVVLVIGWDSDNTLTIKLNSYLSGETLMSESMDGSKLHKAAKFCVGHKLLSILRVEANTIMHNS